MKKYSIVILCALLSYNLYAQQQQKDYAYYNQKIDSLVLDYSVEKVKTINLYDFFYDANLNVKEKKKIIVKIKKMFEQKEYSNLYVLGHRLLYEMYCKFPKDNTIEIRQISMELFLQYYFYPGKYLSLVNSYNIESRFDYTTKAKKRIEDILAEKKTKEEFELYMKAIRTSYASSTYGFSKATQIMKQREIQNATVLKQLRDSVLEVDFLSVDRKELESLPIENELIKIIGLLNMQECIPTLKQGVLFCEQNDCIYGKEKAYRYALARLGDKEQCQYILDHLMDIEEFDRHDFIYFQDDEMIWKYIEVNYFSNKNISVFSSVDLPSSFMTINNIYPYIKNLPKELEYPKDDKERKIRFAWAESVYNWLITNKKTVVFDYAGEKDFEW